MRHTQRIAGMLVVLLMALSAGAETIDRVVAVVNGRAILLSEWDAAARQEVLLDHKSLKSLTNDSRRATLNRMIDQQLMLGEMENSNAPKCSPQEVAVRVREIRAEYSEGADDAAWNSTLQRYGVSPEELETAVTGQLNGLRLLDFRLRSSAQPDERQIANYYRDTYQPAMREKKAQPAPLADVRPQIREILTQQKLGELTTTWLQELRVQADIRLNIGGDLGGPAKP